jgi:hypothetical protein
MKSQLIGVKPFTKDSLPNEGQCVLWIWASQGQITAGDYYRGFARDARTDYQEIDHFDIQPSHWVPRPKNWP